MTKNYYNEIKEQFVNCEVYKRVKDYSKNRKELETYYNVGKLLIEAQGGEERAKYGDSVIKEYSKRLTNELGKGYSQMSLKNMRKFYLLQKRQTLSVFLTWSHYIELLKFKNINEINYYTKIIENEKLSVRELRKRIKNKEYQRLDDKTKKKLITKEETTITDFVKNPIIITSNINVEKITEKILKELILENLDKFLIELGNGFTYVGNEYKIAIGGRPNYIDILLFNIKYNCFVVIELKTTELKKEHLGQIQVYMNYIDENIKSISQNKTIGIIICKENNKYVLKYCSDKRIFSTTYELSI